MSRSLLRRCAALLLAAGLVLPISSATTGIAHADAGVSITNDRGTAMADSTYQTRLTIRGSGFQTVKGGFGGLYVMFGWVRPGEAWKPSNGGTTGTDYRYIPDSESKNNQGYLKFIAFPGSSTAGEAQGVLSGSGSFEVTLTVPGPTFQSVDRDGTVSTVDCRKVTCGVITIGAHGVKNPRNETFTPVRFGTVYDAAPAEQESAAPATTDDGDATQQSGPAQKQATPQGAVRRGRPKVTADRPTARAGNTMAFTGSGFLPGEQVLGILDDGVAAIGPMVAGNSGEVAGIIQLPADLAVGTHELRLTGAASGAAPVERFPVMAGKAPDDTAETDPDEAGGFAASRWFLIVAAALFAVAAVTMALRLVRRRSRPRVATAGGF